MLVLQQGSFNDRGLGAHEFDSRFGIQLSLYRVSQFAPRRAARIYQFMVGEVFKKLLDQSGRATGFLVVVKLILHAVIV